MLNITDIITNIADKIDIDMKVEISDEDLKKASIIRLLNTNFKGSISKIIDYYNIKGVLEGKMILPDDITLEEVEVPFNVEIDTDFDGNNEEDENNLIIFENNIDLIPFLWQNIVLEIPSKVRGKEDKKITLEGDGWRFLTDEEHNMSNNLGLSELKTLLDERKE